MNRMKQHAFSQRGFTLIELLVALAVGGMVMAMTAQMFKSNMTASSLLNQVQNMEINARVATDFIGRDLRAAGMGLNGAGTESLASRPMYLWDNNLAGTADGTSYADIKTQLTARPGTDIIEVFYSYLQEPIKLPVGGGPQPKFSTASAQTHVPQSALTGFPGYDGANASVFEGYSVMIYDCSSSNPDPLNRRCTEVITNAQNTGTNVNLVRNNGVSVDSANRPHSCASLAPATEVCLTIGEDVYYYVYDDPNDPDNPKLARQRLGGARETIANFVEDFQVEVCVDNNAGVANKRCESAEWTGSPAPNESSIRMAKINLMVRTKDLDPRKALEAPPTLDNSTIAELAGTDKYRRRVMSRTIRLRNMGN